MDLPVPGGPMSKDMLDHITTSVILLSVMSNKTAFSYLRFSSPRQEWGDSERRQESLAKEYCAIHGLKLSEKNFADRGISAWKGANRRGALGELLNLLKPGDYLLIEDNDRLSREDPLTAMNLLHSIVFKGVTVITLRDGSIITRENFFNLSIFLPSIVKSALANEENQKKSMRIKESWISRRKKMVEGQFIGGKIPFWLNKNADGALSIIEERAKTIRKIFDMAYGGMGFRSIMHKLATNKTSTFRANVHWSKGGINYLLRNIAVYGAIQPYILDNKKRVPTGEPIENYYPAILTKDKFLAVQNKIAKRITYGGGRAGDNVSNLFSGICKCSKCGDSIILTKKGAHDTSYLTCSAYHWHHQCRSSIINYYMVEKALLDYIAKDADAIQYFSSDDSAQQMQQRIDETKALLLDVEQKVSKLTDLVEQSDAPEPLVLRLKERIAEQHKLKDQLAVLIGNQYAKTNRVSVTSIVMELRKYLAVGTKVTLGPEVLAQLEADRPKLYADRLMMREAFRNSVASMVLDAANKRLTVRWNSGTVSVIEMMCKRQGQKKAIYLYRTQLNGNLMSDWISIGSIFDRTPATAALCQPPAPALPTR
jgi:DNA invertase Pin-like site-specific DNA recombinase